MLQTLDAGPPKEERKKPPGEIIRYGNEFLMKFQEVGEASPFPRKMLCCRGAREHNSHACTYSC